MTSTNAFSELSKALQQIYDERESKNIADWVLEHITGKKKYTRKTDQVILNDEQQKQLKLFTSELLTNKPVQYVLNESFFCGQKFFVDEAVLIPRPETEELVQLIVAENKQQKNLKILDIGTGSGCIPIALKIKLPQAELTAIDISEPALAVATKNANDLSAKIKFLHLDFMDDILPQVFSTFDIIVSNPPYIPQTESEALDKNVRDFEPGVALFVPDNDPLIFYKQIEQFARRHLKEDGSIYLEAHERYAKAVSRLFQASGWKAQTLKDMFEKERMIKVTF